MKQSSDYLEAKRKLQLKHQTKWLFMLIIAGCLGLAIFGTSCNTKPYVPPTETVEGCEYFVSSGIRSHKGTCKNPIHQTIIHDTVWFTIANGRPVEINLKK